MRYWCLLGCGLVWGWSVSTARAELASAAVSEDGQTVAVLGQDGQVSVRSREKDFSFNSGLKWPDLHLSPEGSYLLVHAPYLKKEREKGSWALAYFALWDCKKGTEIGRQFDGGPTASIVFSADERYFALANGGTGKVTIYGTADSRPVRKISLDKDRLVVDLTTPREEGETGFCVWHSPTDCSQYEWPTD